ncbi:MAG: phosphoenolpyruvate--protein phosphotransferase [Mycoplasmataceae bacterium]|nr:phosphoenolpyruvate--protein phosphotransferase [Mycoplasmataceae bacterium]
MSMQLKGIGASNGVAINKSYLLVQPKFDITDAIVDNPTVEIKRFHKALEDSATQLTKIKAIATNKLGADKAEVFEAHIQIVNDPEIIQEVERTINETKVNAAFAIRFVFDKYFEMFKNMTDTYFKERAADVKDVKRRVLSNILNVALPNIVGINEEVIIIAHDLTPSETALLDKKYVKGFITEIGGRTSHAAIMARTMEIPAILGLEDILNKVKNDQVVALNGLTGEVEIEPKNPEEWKKLITLFEKEKQELKKYINVPSITVDGHKVHLGANIGKPSDVDAIIAHGAEGIGLYRSEFLYMDNDHWPTEDEQYDGYKAVLEKMTDKLVVIRTLDIGGDKKLSYFQFPHEDNPFLGYRAIRFCLDNKEIFKTQLRALGRASVFGKLGIMFPMIATIDEFKEAKSFAESTFAELRKEGKKVSDDIQLGMMTEIPSSAVLAKQFGKYADFFSIGTNDLNQYTFACDRMSQKVAYLYQPNNPSLLSLVKFTIDGGHLNKRWIGMCGEMAGDILSIPILLGLGLDEFSMSATSIPKARMIVNNLSFKECQLLANKTLELDTMAEVTNLVSNFLKQKKLI